MEITNYKHSITSSSNTITERLLIRSRENECIILVSSLMKQSIRSGNNSIYKRFNNVLAEFVSCADDIVIEAINEVKFDPFDDESIVVTFKGNPTLRMILSDSEEENDRAALCSVTNEIERLSPGPINMMITMLKELI